MSDTDDPEEPRLFATRNCPPVETRFKPGQSGNPKGRPKRDTQLASLVDAELNRKMNVTVDGRRRKLSKREVIARKLVDDVVKGDRKALTACMAMLATLGAQRKHGADAMLAFEVSPEDDEQILGAFMARQMEEPDHDRPS